MSSQKPNLIYVFADQLRYFSLGYTGDKNAATPNIDALCQESTDLCQAVSGHPVCAALPGISFHREIYPPAQVWLSMK